MRRDLQEQTTRDVFYVRGDDSVLCALLKGTVKILHGQQSRHSRQVLLRAWSVRENLFASPTLEDFPGKRNNFFIVPSTYVQRAPGSINSAIRFSPLCFTLYSRGFKLYQENGWSLFRRLTSLIFKYWIHVFFYSKGVENSKQER